MAGGGLPTSSANDDLCWPGTRSSPPTHCWGSWPTPLPCRPRRRVAPAPGRPHAVRRRAAGAGRAARRATAPAGAGAFRVEPAPAPRHYSPARRATACRRSRSGGRGPVDARVLRPSQWRRLLGAGQPRRVRRLLRRVLLLALLAMMGVMVPPGERHSQRGRAPDRRPGRRTPARCWVRSVRRREKRCTP